MSSHRRLEGQLPRLLDDLYVGSMPAYRDQILHQTARTRQRPAWSFPGRWLPMVDIVRQSSLAPRLPWRAIALTLVLLAVIVAAVAAFAAGHPGLPKPFGPARNGLVSYGSGGEIFTVDAGTGKSTTIDKGPGDTNPRYSRDGTQIAFSRLVSGSSTSLVYVVKADGSGLIQVTPQPLPEGESYTFSPDGRQLMISASPASFTDLVIAATDGSGIRHISLPGRANVAAWRPPVGSEILFMDEGTDQNATDTGIYAVNAQDGKVRTILAGADQAGRFRGHPAWSPDGSQISFGEWPGLNGIDAQTHIIAADGTGDRPLPIPANAVWQAPETWSNDGTRLLAIRGYTGDITQARPVVVPVAGSGFGVEIPYPGGINTGNVSDWEWAPDDTSILGTPSDDSGTSLEQVLINPVAGTSSPASWQSVSQPSWQRLAP